MNKSELVALVAKREGISQYKLEKIFSQTINVIEEVLRKGGKVQIKGYGSFEARQSNERICRNLYTGRLFYLGKKNYVMFKLSKKFKYSI